MKRLSDSIWTRAITTSLILIFVVVGSAITKKEPNLDLIILFLVVPMFIWGGKEGE